MRILRGVQAAGRAILASALLFFLAPDSRAFPALPNCNVFAMNPDEDVVIKCLDDGKNASFVCAGSGSQLCNSAPAPCNVGLTNAVFTAYCGSLPAAAATAAPPPASQNLTEENAARRMAIEAELAAAAKKAAEETARNTAKVSEESKSSHEASIKAASEVSLIGANNAASVGAIYCAQAANDQLQDTKAAASEYASCNQYFDAAKSMQNNQMAAGGFQADKSIVDGSAAKGALSDFEKNFGVPGEDYLSRILKSGGDRAELSDMLKAKFDESQMKAVFEAAASATPDAFVVSYAGGGTKKSNGNALRDSLKKALDASAGESRRPAALGASDDEVKKESGPKIRGLLPLHEGIFATEELEEITIFAVVHRRYVEILRKQDL